MKLNITTLIENNPDPNYSLRYEHGLSLLLEIEDTRILFDTGQSGDFIANACKLKKNLEKLDYVILSHGHYDHTGGVKRFLKEMNNRPHFIVGEEFFRYKYKKIGDQIYKYIV